MFAALRTPATAARRVLPAARLARGNSTYTEAKAAGGSIPLPYQKPGAAASDAHGHDHSDHHDHAHGHETVSSSPAQPEGYSKGYYISIASVLSVLALYKLDHAMAGDKGTLLTRLIAKYQSSLELWEARNSLHTELIQKAAFDKTLFQDQRRKTVVHLKYPQTFNVSSPHNVETGWATGDLEVVYDHYWKEKNEYVPWVMRAENNKA